jgi:hypothetical protein
VHKVSPENIAMTCNGGTPRPRQWPINAGTVELAARLML